jgi:hypothetical protein
MKRFGPLIGVAALAIMFAAAAARPAGTANPSADFSVAKKGSKDSVGVGETLTYTVTQSS